VIKTIPYRRYYRYALLAEGIALADVAGLVGISATRFWPMTAAIGVGVLAWWGRRAVTRWHDPQ